MSRRPQQPDDTERETGFIDRWSKRKQQARTGGSPQPVADRPVEPEEDASAEEQVKRDEDMPPVDSLDEGSDVSEFFSPGVSEALRRAALRKFFHSPAFNVVDGLDDYAEDFTSFSALGKVVTADMRHRMEFEQERENTQQEEEEIAQDANGFPPEEAVAAADDGGDHRYAGDDQDNRGEDEAPAGSGRDGRGMDDAPDSRLSESGEDAGKQGDDTTG